MANYFSTVKLTDQPVQYGATLDTSSAPVYVTDANCDYRVYLGGAGDDAPDRDAKHLKRRVVNGEVQTFEVVPADGLYGGDLYFAAERAGQTRGEMTVLTGLDPA